MIQKLNSQNSSSELLPVKRLSSARPGYLLQSLSPIMKMKHHANQVYGKIVLLSLRILMNSRRRFPQPSGVICCESAARYSHSALVARRRRIPLNKSTPGDLFTQNDCICQCCKRMGDCHKEGNRQASGP